MTLRTSPSLSLLQKP
ncbi:hypothetical protein E2C01_068390 [Portunus trituberculatus]|uniref:Uncharacterized protein n=1 Tax=Portunus trituberculatus TaxID=210409 RepID=A0A5B7HW23_PORTR|nr:hypothetical protein [Portunus trituberculatus]